MQIDWARWHVNIQTTERRWLTPAPTKKMSKLLHFNRIHVRFCTNCEVHTLNYKKCSGTCSSNNTHNKYFNRYHVIHVLNAKFTVHSDNDDNYYIVHGDDDDDDDGNKEMHHHYFECLIRNSK